MWQMLNLKQIDLIKEYAVGAVLSDSADLSYDAIVEELDQDNIPEEIIIWAPFETLDAQALLEQIEEQYNIFEIFAERLMEEN